MDLSESLSSETKLNICDVTVSSSNETVKATIISDISSIKADDMPEINARATPRDMLCSLDQIGLPNSWSEDDQAPYPLQNQCVLDFLPLLPAPATYAEMPDLETHTENVISGVCGLRNLGNTCFMNSGLQCLFNNHNLVSYFLDTYKMEPVISKDSLSSQFAALMSKVWTGQFATIKPVDFKEALGVWHPQFRDYRQHDCQEFLALLLDMLHEQLNTGSCKNFAYNVKKVTELDEKESPTELMDTESNVVSDVSKPRSNDQKNAVQMAMNNVGSSESSSSTSPHSTDSFGSWDTNPSFRMYPVPEDVKPFSDVISAVAGHSKIESNSSSSTSLMKNPNEFIESPNNGKHCSSNLIPLEALTNKGGSMVKKNPIEGLASGMESKLVNNEMQNCVVNQCAMGSGGGMRKIPTFEDFVKETKTLNTNVLVSEETNNLLKFDSEKFPKTEPPMRPHEALDNLSNLMAIDNASTSKKQVGGNSLKRLKETNVLQERKENSSVCTDLIPKRMKIESLGDDDRLEDDDIDDDVEDQGKGELRGEKTETKDGHSNYGASIKQKDDNFEADSEWAKYHSKNQSVIVDTFQGQFKSTVICSECGHISVTYEPFMYLPVPLPYALERQIVVTYVPRSSRRGLVRYLLTVHKNDKLIKLKEVLLNCLGENGNSRPDEIILAEVFDNHISRILEDNVLVRYINDTNREVFAFEVASPGSLEDGIQPGSPQDEIDVTSNKTPPSSSQLCSSSSSTAAPAAGSALALGVGGNCRQHFQPSLGSSGDHCISSTSPLPHWMAHDNAMPPSSSSDFTSENVSSSTRDEFGPSTSTSSSSSLQPDLSLSIINSGAAASSLAPGDCDPSAPPSRMNSSPDGGDDGTGSEEQRVANNHLQLLRSSQMGPWHPCAICLDDFPDGKLRTHPPCQCLLCQSCITTLFKQYVHLTCPVCSVPIKSEDEFVPVLKMDDFQTKIRLISVPVVFRLNTRGQLKLIGHPNLLRIPDCLSASTLYECIDQCVPFLATYSLFFVDGQGKFCSRCIYTHKCTGCEVSRFGDIVMQAGDNLAITFDALSNDFPLDDVLTVAVEDHKSMMNKRAIKESLTLYDCLKAFSESETLDEQNPWFCPACQRHRQARKSLSVWRCPDTLMVYLKRFMFHEFSSTKVDDKVLFPLEGLDLSPFISGPAKDYQPYNLQACVCHFGGVSSGHYTAYSKHIVSGEWNYFNDDTTREQKPQEEDNIHAYILFYQKPGSQSTNPSLSNATEGIIFEKSDMSPDDGSCSSLGLKPDTISHILKQLEDCSDETGNQGNKEI